MSEDAPVRAVESSDPAIVYLDHGASSWPKPPVVVDAVIEALTQVGGNPGRGGHRLALEAARRIFAVRQTCATLLGVPDSKNLIFTSGCTAACNMMLKGVLKPGDRVVVGSMEHNAVARPLEVLQAAGVEVVRVQGDSAGVIDPDAVEAAVRARPTRAVICQHASNVSGTIQPIAQIADVAHEAGALMLVDGAQAGGHLDLNLAALGADAYAVSGHKGMLGPQGVGLLYIRPKLEVEEICQGGTGSHSESTQMPTERPDRYEAGTPNTPGILGIGAAAAFLAEEGRSLRQREATLIRELHEGILALGTYTVLGPPPDVERVPVLSVIPHSMTPAHLATRLDREYGIACRAGLHCAPWAHETLGSRDTGACRFGIGYGNTTQHVATLLEALEELAG